MKVLKMLSLASFLIFSSAFANTSGVSTSVSNGQVHVRVVGQAAAAISKMLTKASSKITGEPPRHYTKIVTGKNITCTTSSGFAFWTACYFFVDADGLLGIPTVGVASNFNGTVEVSVKNKIASVTISGQAGVIIMKAMKNLVGYGTRKLTKSSDDISCTMKNMANNEGSCFFNLDAYGSASSDY